MPIYEIVCGDCGRTEEILVTGQDEVLVCPSCGSTKTSKLMSATSSMTGQPQSGLPGAGDTTCCGNEPGDGACAGPGSCCGKN